MPPRGLAKIWYVDNEGLTEYGLPALVSVDDDMTTTSLMHQRAAENPDRPYCEYKNRQGEWITVTLREFSDRVDAAAKGIAAMGVKTGDSVGLLASTRFEWAVFDFAIMAAGALTVPIYPSSSASQLEWIVSDAALRLLIVETPKNAALALSVPGVPQVLTIEGDEPAVDVLVAAGHHVTDAELTARTTGIKAGDIASLVYTSGTTGNPKGVELTHGNLVEHALNAAAYPELQNLTSPGKRILLFLPLAHVLARHLEILTMASGMTLGFAPSPTTLPSDLRGFKPHWMLAVPRVLETFYNTAEAKTGGGTKQKLFRWSAEVSRRTAAARAKGRVSPLLAVQMRVADALVLHKVREAMGGEMQYIVSGGARLSPSLAYFYAGIGVTVLEGYGLTESSAPATCNPQNAPRVGTVGLPLPGCTVRIAEDGEVLIKGSNVFAGYHHHPEVTAEVLKDGWFATGDLGHLDADGYLAITGRKKEIIVTDAGKNVQPAGLEDAIRPDPVIQEVIVVGDAKPFIGALISLDQAMLRNWLSMNGLPVMTVAEASQHPDVKAHLKAIINEANKGVSKAEAVRRWRVLPRELTEADGEISASLKVRRRVVMDHFADLVDDMYATPGR